MKNSSFWYSLIAFCLLMCSCKSSKMDSNVRVRNELESELSYMNKAVKIDSSKTAYFAKEIQNIVFDEVITETEYDKESGKPIKETKTERKITQDSDKVVAEEENKGQSEVKNDSLNHIADVSKKVESETKEESKGGQEAFGKWIGIVIGCIIGLLIIYLLRKLRIN